MAEPQQQEPEKPTETVIDKLKESLHLDGSSSSSDSEEDKEKNNLKKGQDAAEMKSNVRRIFGRERPVHHVLGGGKSADVFLWRNKKISAGVLAGATAVWVLFELLEYHLLTLICHCLIVSLTLLFIWASATSFINKSTPHIPEVSIPEEMTINVARSMCYEINRAIALIGDIASGHNLKAFLSVIAGLWILSIIGSCCNFVTLFYIAFVLLHTVPVLYEKYEDQVDSFAEKACQDFQKHYAVFHAKVVSKIPRKDKKN